MPVGVNSGANKLDAFLHRSIRYRVRLQPDGSAKANASVTLRNDGPSSGLPRYVIGPDNADGRAGQNDQLHTLYVADAYGFTRGHGERPSARPPHRRRSSAPSACPSSSASPPRARSPWPTIWCGPMPCSRSLATGSATS